MMVNEPASAATIPTFTRQMSDLEDCQVERDIPPETGASSIIAPPFVLSITSFAIRTAAVGSRVVSSINSV